MHTYYSKEAGSEGAFYNIMPTEASRNSCERYKIKMILTNRQHSKLARWMVHFCILYTPTRTMHIIKLCNHLLKQTIIPMITLIHKSLCACNTVARDIQLQIAEDHEELQLSL